MDWFLHLLECQEVLEKRTSFRYIKLFLMLVRRNLNVLSIHDMRDIRFSDSMLQMMIDAPNDDYDGQSACPHKVLTAIHLLTVK